MRIGSFNLHKTFGADGLIATSSTIEVGRVVKEADGTLDGILIEICLNGLAIDERIPRQLYLLRGRVNLGVMPGGC